MRASKRLLNVTKSLLTLISPKSYIVRKEIGAPVAKVLAADERYSLVVPAK